MTSSPFFDNVCTLPLTSDLFTQALHPNKPLLTIGLASGHVQTYRLPSTTEQESCLSSELQPRRESINGTSSILSQRRRSSTASENGLGSIDTIWKTRRHKGSCRALTYAPDGNTCYSGGTDGLIKAFDAESGRVTSKIAVPVPPSSDEDIDAPTVLHVLTPRHLIVTTDSGALHIYDLEDSGKAISPTPSHTHHPHGAEHVNAIVPIPPGKGSTSGYPKQFITVGSTTLSVVDIRKGVVATSEDQEVELSSVTLLEGLKSGGTSVGSKVLIGQADGVISLFERGVWGDLDERLVADREGASIDALCEVPVDFLPVMGKLKMNEKIVAAGLDDGRVRFVRVGRNAVIYEWDLKHDEMEGVISILFDQTENRMITGGGQTVKIWTKANAVAGLSLHVGTDGDGKRARDEGSEEDDWESDEDSDKEELLEMGDSEDEREEERGAKRKKRKRNKGKDKSGGKALNLAGIF